MFTRLFIFVTLIFVWVGLGNTIVKNNFTIYQQTKKQIENRGSGLREIFKSVEAGILNSDVGMFSEYLSKQVSVSLHGAENGSFSSNQAYYIIQNYFTSIRLTGFSFSTIQTDSDTPFATGGGTVVKKGKREFIQIYVSLARRDHKWVITQFNVY